MNECLDWSRVVAATYEIEQSFRYEYAAPIERLRQRLIVAPRIEHGDQRRLSHAVAVDPHAVARYRLDRFGNSVVTVDAPHVTREIEFSLHAVVERDSRRLLAPRGSRRTLWTPPSDRRLVRPDAALAAAGAQLLAQHADERARAEALVAFVQREMTYSKDATDVFTTAAVAFAMGRGVCQDYAHVALALARACGLRARYVSGHLIGEGATHAWIEFALTVDGGPELVSFDPTRGTRTDLRYVTVAVGHDYSDVAPTSGVFLGSSAGRLTARQCVRVVAATLAQRSA